MNKQEHALETLWIKEALRPVVMAHWEKTSFAGMILSSCRFFIVGVTFEFATVVVMVTVPAGIVEICWKVSYVVSRTTTVLKVISAGDTNE